MRATGFSVYDCKVLPSLNKVIYSILFIYFKFESGVHCSGCFFIFYFLPRPAYSLDSFSACPEGKCVEGRE